MESSDELVTVIDPRHPLYRQSFRLIGITTKQYLGRCCVVLDHASRERNIPLAVTDRSPDPLAIASSPLTIATIEGLIHVFSHRDPQPAMAREEADGRDASGEHRDHTTQQSALGREERTHLNRSSRADRAGLGLPFGSPATNGGSRSRQDLPSSSASSTDGQRGGSNA